MSEFVEEKIIQELADEAVRELFAYREANRKGQLKELAKKALGRGSHRRDDIFWPAGLLMLGLMESGRIQEIEQYLQTWLNQKTRAVYVDDAVAGYVFLHLYEKTARLEYKEAADAIAAFLLNARRDKVGSIIYNQERTKNYIFADGAGQTSLFLARYGAIFEKKEAADLARTQIINFLQYGMDAFTGLPYHGYDAETGIKYGIVGWGRAVGWLMMGIAGYCEAFPEDGEMAQVFTSMTRHVLQYWRKDHLFSWQLPALDGPVDTSAAGMILWSVRAAKVDAADVYSTRTRAVGEYDPERDDFAADTAAALRAYINGGKVYGASAECIDFSMYRQQYGNFPWGQGAVLAFLACKR